MKSSISRRDFLKGTLATAGLTIAASISPFGCKLLNAEEARKAHSRQTHGLRSLLTTW